MDFNKNNIKKILGIITFTLVLLALLMNMGKVWSFLAFLWGILFPFILGFAMAFILNIPMTAIEQKLFPKGGKPARPVSLLLSLVGVLAVLAIVIVVVIPQLGKTFDSISAGMATFLPQMQKWLEDIFRDWDMIESYIKSLEFDWVNWLNGVKDFALSGAGNTHYTGKSQSAAKPPRQIPRPAYHICGAPELALCLPGLCGKCCW